MALEGRMQTIDLAERPWLLEGWRQNEWALEHTTESAIRRAPDIGPIPARVPGSVRSALVAAGIVPDPLRGADSRASEFIENRHWFMRTQLPAEFSGGEVTLELGAIDGPGQVLLAGRVIAEVDNSHLNQRIPLGRAEDVAGAELSIAFLTPPDELGQIGRTDSIRAWKPRFYYGWDWVPRIVQFGVLRYARLAITAGPQVTSTTVRTHLGDAGGEVHLTWESDAPDDHRVAVTVALHGATVAQTTFDVSSGGGIVLVANPELWQVAERTTDPALYRVQLRLEGPDGEPLDSADHSTGFRSLRWLSNPGASEDAAPWLLELNSEPLFLQGVNWVPVRPDFADVVLEDLRLRLQTYRDLGVTIIRVWGGATIEDDAFYNLCDEFGILVWQELPLSSSGLNNTPPSDPAFASELAMIAGHWVRRLCSHPSIVIWSGGNELAQGEEPPGTPLTFDHPALAAALASIRDVDPEVRVIPTSPSGPRYVADAAEFGHGLHHDVHGPWAHAGPVEDWQAYWDGDDALFRSEVGIAGASPLDLLERYGLAADPAGEAGWRHSSVWWLQDGVPGPNEVPAWVAASQQRQAHLLGIAAAASKARFPQCGGFIVWLGHDTFPCAVSLSLLDAEGRPKPAANALGRVFRARPDELRASSVLRRDARSPTLTPAQDRE